MKTLFTTSLVIASLFASSLHAKMISASDVAKNYASLVYATYNDTYKDALDLHKSIDVFLTSPNEENLQKAKQVWLKSRNSFLQTEAFRFYEGPIDFVDEEKGMEGPEARLNSWPLNEALIDYVAGNPQSGIVQNSSLSLTKEILAEENQKNDEKDVTTGYHAIEFLLWGQDLSLDSPGKRPASDYAKIEKNNRRRDYLRIITDMLVDDLKFLVESWKPGKKNYAQKFIQQDEEDVLTDLLTSLATLSSYEMAADRMGVSLDSGDQEDEHSCFSDNTHIDFIQNAQGIKNVFFGEYGSIKGASLYAFIKQKDSNLAEKIKKQLSESEKFLKKIPFPYDRELLATPKESEARHIAEHAVESLHAQAKLFQEAGTLFGLDIKINE